MGSRLPLTPFVEPFNDVMSDFQFWACEGYFF
jgi:hypothetical protein